MNNFEQSMEAAERARTLATTELVTDIEKQRLIISRLVPVYQEAFTGEPWFEVSRCGGCSRGFSAQRPGETCADCGTQLIQTAYPDEELSMELLTAVEQLRTAIYLERDSNGEILLGAMAWQATPEEVFRRKYKGNAQEAMLRWLGSNLPDRLVWLDEVFANRRLRPSGNLGNFRTMCEQFTESLGSTTIAYRSINRRIIRKAEKEFGASCVVYEQEERVPDRRTLVVLTEVGGAQ